MQVGLFTPMFSFSRRMPRHHYSTLLQHMPGSGSIRGSDSLFLFLSSLFLITTAGLQGPFGGNILLSESIIDWVHQTQLLRPPPLSLDILCNGGVAAVPLLLLAVVYRKVDRSSRNTAAHHQTSISRPFKRYQLLHRRVMTDKSADVRIHFNCSNSRREGGCRKAGRAVPLALSCYSIYPISPTGFAEAASPVGVRRRSRLKKQSPLQKKKEK